MSAEDEAPCPAPCSLLAAFLGHIKNESGQTPAVLSGCWDALIFTFLEKMMSLLLYISVLKQKKKESSEFVQNRAFQFYLAPEFCYIWVMVKKIKVCLAGTHWMWKSSGQVTGRKRSGCSHTDAGSQTGFEIIVPFRSFPFILQIIFKLAMNKKQRKICKMTSQSLLEQENKPFMPLPGVLWEAKSFTMVNHGSRAAWNYCFLKWNCC